MVAIYSDNRALDVISLLTACKIVTLDIFLDESSFEHDAAEYVFKYTTTSDYSEAEREEIYKKIQAATGYFIKAANDVKEFMTMKLDDNVKGFSLSFDIRENKLKVNKVYKETVQTEDCNSLQYLLNKLEEVTIDNCNTKVNMYHKIPNPNGKRPKFEEMTLKEVINILRTMEM